MTFFCSLHFNRSTDFKDTHICADYAVLDKKNIQFVKKNMMRLLVGTHIISQIFIVIFT